LMKEILINPTTWISLAVIGLGCLTWIARDSLIGISNRLLFIRRLANGNFGFDFINEIIVKGINSSAEFLRKSQTGQLNWNIFGILSGLIIVIAILLIGA